MASIEAAILDFKRLDQMAEGETGVHTLDPRAKVLVTLIFIVTVVSFDRYELAAMFPFFIFPAVLIGQANLPPAFIAKKIALLCPLAWMVGMFNPVFDRQVMIHLGSLAISGGWISFASIIVRAILTVGAGVILLAVTGFPAICQALERMGTPTVFAVQLHFLYRYIFVLAEEGGRVSRARTLRSCGKKGLGVRSYGSLVGHLLLRTWRRAERIHMAMVARGFTGEFHSRHSFHFGGREVLFLLGWSALFLFLRLQNLSQLVGGLATGLNP